MDIRIINSEGELMNVGRLSLKVINTSLIGIDEEKNVVNIETYRTEGEAREVLEKIVFCVWDRHERGIESEGIIINLNEEYKKRFDEKGE